MLRRPSLFLALTAAAVCAIAVSVAVAGPVGAGVSTPNGNVQAVGVLIAPKKLSKTGFTPASLEVTTRLRTTTAANGVPKPTVRVVLDFDRNARLFTKGLPTCDPALLQNQSTEVALQKCRRAKIGSGKATALLPLGQVFTIDQTVTAFNGVPKGGKPVVLLHTYGATPIQTTLVLVGTLSPYNKQGYGQRLDLEVPKIAGGAGALTDFQVKVSRSWTYKGRRVNYISAKCPSSRKLKGRGEFIFIDGESSTPTSTQTCTPKK